MSKNILFLVTGMTPQILTETVWALACDPDNSEPWIPDEIHVVSTGQGLDQIRARLFGEGHFLSMQKEYPQLASIKFDEEGLHGITDENGLLLNDLKTPADNELAANLICEKIRTFTEDKEISLHVSIAGGRKTMGFYAGYALSLYGRAQDSMSHVLVDERYESAKNFYYPSKDPNVFAYNHKDLVIGPTASAKVWLAQIPFVRMKEAIEEKHQLNRGESFSEVVEKINESYNETEIVLNVKESQLIVNNKFDFKLPPREFAFLCLFAENKKNQDDGIVLPTVNLDNKKAEKKDIENIGLLTEKYREIYSKVKQTADLDDLQENEKLSFEKRFADNVKSLLKSRLVEKLGLELASKIAIQQDARGKPFYLNLPENSIHINY